VQKLVFIFILSFLTLFTAYIDAAPVYIAKDSRAYHYDRNCSDLNTNDLIEFASPQKADDAGAIPCKHCNSSTVKEKISDSRNAKKEVPSKSLEDKEEKSNKVRKGVQSFSIKGLKIGMTDIQTANAKLIQTKDGALSYFSTNTGRNNNEKIIYSIRWEKRFNNYEKAEDILLKLQETYGKWSDAFYRNTAKQSDYYVIWGAKFKKNKIKDSVRPLRETVSGNVAYAVDCITSKLFFLALVVSHHDGRCFIYLRLHNAKIYTDALKAEHTRKKQQKIEQQEDISKLEFR
jgi:hypothetical protein